MANPKLIIESMTHCEAEVLTKVLETGNTKAAAVEILEGLRRHKFQSVIWDMHGKYMGGTSYNPLKGKWTAEFLHLIWDCPEAVDPVLSGIEEY